MTFNSNLLLDPITGFNHSGYQKFYSKRSTFARTGQFSENYNGKFFEDASLYKVSLMQNLDIKHNTKEIEKLRNAKITLDCEIEQLTDKKRKLDVGIIRAQKRLLRKKIEMEARVLIQRVYIGHYCRKKLKIAREYYLSTLMEKTVRGWLVRRRIMHMNNAAKIIQTLGRGYITRKHKNDFVEAHRHRIASLITVQSVIRGFLDRRAVFYKKKRMNQAVVKIQRAWREILDDVHSSTFITQYDSSSSDGRKPRRHSLIAQKMAKYSAREEVKSVEQPDSLTSTTKSVKKKIKPIKLFNNPNGNKHHPVTKKEILDSSQHPLDMPCYADYFEQIDEEDNTKLCKIYSETYKRVGDKPPEVETYGEYMEYWTGEEKERILREQLELRLWKEKQMEKQVSKEIAVKAAKKAAFKSQSEQRRKEVIKKGSKKIEEQKKQAKQNKRIEATLTENFKAILRSDKEEKTQQTQAELDDWKIKKAIEKQVIREFNEKKMRQQAIQQVENEKEAQLKIQLFYKKQRQERKKQKEKEEQAFQEEMAVMEEKEKKRRQFAVVGYDLARLRLLKNKRDELLQLKNEIDAINVPVKYVAPPPKETDSESSSLCYCDSYDTESLLEEDLSIDDTDKLILLKAKQEELINKRDELHSLNEADDNYYQYLLENQDTTDEERLEKLKQLRDEYKQIQDG